jgi:hypothetical protein
MTINKKLLSASLFILVLISFLIVPFLSSAQGLKNINAGIDVTAQSAGVKSEIDVTQFISILIQALLGVLALIFIILMIYGGVTWMTAAGSEEKVLKAKKIIINSAIGFIIIILSYTIVIFVIGALEKTAE